jgi:hypothetical protein
MPTVGVVVAGDGVIRAGFIRMVAAAFVEVGGEIGDDVQPAICAVAVTV